MQLGPRPSRHGRLTKAARTNQPQRHGRPHPLLPALHALRLAHPAPQPPAPVVPHGQCGDAGDAVVEEGEV